MNAVPDRNHDANAASNRTTLHNSPPDRDVQSDALKSLADELLATYHTSHSVADLEEAIGLYEKTLRLRSAGHMRRAESLNDLGNAFFLFCFHHESDKTRSNRCIELHREALRLRTPGHPLRDQSLHNLARSLRTIIHHQLGGLEILMECASLNREALQLRPSGHPERWRCMDDLATDLTRIVEHTGDIDMQAEIVSMRRAVLRMSSPGHPSRETSLNHLASAIVISFEHRGGSDDLAEAISVSREALNLRPIGHPRRFSSLVNLANTLALRAIYEGPSQLLTEAIGLYREAASLLSGSHPARAIIMLNLSESLLTSFRIRGDGSALVEAIGLLRELVTLPSYAHDDTLSNLAEALEAKYDEGTSTKALSNTANLGRGDLHLQPIGPRGDLNVLSEALKLHRDALQLRPVGHVRWFLSLEGLARVLCRIRCESWPEALSSYQEALDACPVGYPARVRLLSGMSKCFLDPSSPSFSLSEGISCLSEAYAHPFTHVSGRLKSAGPDLQHLEAAYDHDASTRATQTSSHSRDETKVLDLYAQVIDLLPLAANFGLDHSARLQALTSSEGIARNAAARAMLLDCLPQAVEMLEQGRGVFWTQTLHLRANAFDEVPEDDRKELQRMLRVLEHGARRVESMDQSPAQQERELQTRRQLNEAVQALISKIRDYPDLDRFLLPPAFDALFGSLPDGFVVILNASKLGHHALLLNRSTALATSLALKPFQIGFDFAKLRAQLPRDMMSATERGSDGETRAMRIDSGRTRSFEDVLSLLWTSVVKPVLDALGLNKSQGLARPRLWWCVTGELGFLPIHAAGSYIDASSVCAANYVVSSYIPTLASLAKARALWTPIARSDLTGLLICESSTAESSIGHLSDAFDEVFAVHGCFTSAGAQVLNAPTAHTSVSELRALLEGTQAHTLHMACHGIQHSDPLKSAFLLHDGRLSIEDIIQFNLPHAFLAFLSACQTAKGDQNAPDQAVHLAASMLFCGFRSVVGTMWYAKKALHITSSLTVSVNKSMCDEDGPKVARHFYNSLFERDQVDLDDIAYAHDEAVQTLRQSGVPAARWAPFMHIGG